MAETDLGKLALTLLQEARSQKSQFESDLREAYFFAAPHRGRAMNSQNRNVGRLFDQGDLDTSIAMVLCDDFVTLIMNTFMPENEAWAVRKPGPWLKDDVIRQEVEEQASEADKQIFAAINASMFHSECAKGFKPDLPIGTVGMWIDDPRPWGAVACQAVPLHELEVALGPDGNIDFRAHVRHVRNRELEYYLKGATLPPSIMAMKRDRPNHTSVVQRCFWRDWSVDGDVVWQYVCLVGKEVVQQAQLRGYGSCPLIVGRFDPCPEWALGWGPLLKSLPEIRQYESIERGWADHVDLALRPPVSLPDDSFTNFEGGIETGTGYPIRPGTEGAIKNIYDAPPANVAVYDQQNREAVLRKMFYLDWPEQQGKTPPSASQWLDQVTMSLRRIGTPGQPFWREFCGEAFMRFAFIMEKRGAIKPVEVDGKSITLEPYNPAARAVEANEVAAGARFMEIGGQGFPEEFKMEVDGSKSLRNFAKKLGALKIIEFRSDEDKQAAIEGITQLMGGAVPGAPEIGGQPQVAPEPVSRPDLEQRNYMTGRA